MKKNVVSQAGDWSQWTSDLKESLQSSQDNTQVGEKLVFENDEFCIWSIHLPAGKSLPFHKHAIPYFWTALSEGKSRSYYNDGSIMDSQYDSGDTMYFDDLSADNYFIHNLENIGETTLVFTTVEFLRK